MISNPVLRTTSRLLSRTLANGFCIGKGMLDPHKHVFMNHNPHTMYVDYWPMGQYPELIVNRSIASRQYEPRIKQIILDTIKSKYVKNVQLSEQDLMEVDADYLMKYTIKSTDSPHVLMQIIFKNLSTGIFVRQSKFTWIIEQQSRFTPEFIEIFNDVKSMTDFIAQYNEAIERMVVFSHLGTCSLIPQAPTPQQAYLSDQKNNQATGVADLQEERPENQKYINRLLKLLHAA